VANAKRRNTLQKWDNQTIMVSFNRHPVRGLQLLKAEEPVYGQAQIIRCGGFDAGRFRDGDWKSARMVPRMDSSPS
jgi:hypothetical protein